ncbi:TPA: hypothetical protein DIV48_01025 [Candidatus Kaiserbacteria bacterium]|nr:MAG: Excinuclease ABC, C subunit [Parcubacteria group bacterium GW2011_GWA1_56_13]KKW46780.1 MAG: Excinuclease ABC, C subunit [Parcubacteria group bacterium GW2011_GWB1_57_6]HCR52213.1 hypothetical protein [Candidatus Kaiserbacteria bacterium]
MQKRELHKYNLPDVPGVYLFLQKRGKAKTSATDVRPTDLKGRYRVLYVGKATSLHDRVRSYFDDDLIATRGPRVVDMVTKADRISFEPTPTVLEALVREAALIKKYHPAANVEGKDDSSFLYAVITEEAIPRVLALRGKDIKFRAMRSVDGQKLKDIFGPFPSGAQLREGLRLIRRIFPFFDTPRPVGYAGKHQAARLEFNRQIGHYPREFTVPEYRATIRKVRLLLSGRGKELRRMLEKEMRHAAKEERFEDAAEARRELFALDHIQDVSLIKDENVDHRSSTSSGQSAAGRIEAYDTAHISGTNAIGVMTVVVAGVPVKKEYRTFRIRGSTGSTTLTTRSSPQAASKEVRKLNDDIASLKEVLSRRLEHPEWPFPSVIVVDGGTAHKKAAEDVLKGMGVGIPVAAVVKDERHRPREVIGARHASIGEADAVLANSEAHRFALAHHRRARSVPLRAS